MRYSLVVVCLLIVLAPAFADARHGGSSIDRSSLDSDIVESISIPVLFGITYEDINPDFADPRDGGDRSHEGEDLMSIKGAPIVSPTEAIVTKIGEGSSAGNYVYTANPGGETFRYMHLDEIADIKVGDKLSVGDLIGTVGDTGNAGEGVYHLHFEMRDEDNQAQDPYPRLNDTFTLKEKMSFLTDILQKVDDEDEYATFLVETYQSEFKEAVNAGYSLPKEIQAALKEAGVFSTVTLQKQLDDLIASLPKVLSTELRTGDQEGRVTLLQLYLIYTLENSAAKNALIAAGPTGYYGSITSAAVMQLQVENKVALTGVYDTATRQALID